MYTRDIDFRYAADNQDVRRNLQAHEDDDWRMPVNQLLSAIQREHPQAEFLGMTFFLSPIQIDLQSSDDAE